MQFVNFDGHRTKRMVVDVLKVQPGDNLTEVLYTPATPEQVKHTVHVQDTVVVTAISGIVHRLAVV